MKDALYYQRLLSERYSAAKDYRKEVAAIEKKYASAQRFNVLYSNAELLQAALKTNDPKPVIRTRFPKEQSANGGERNTARIVSEIAERAIVYNNEQNDINKDIADIILQTLLSGRGVAKVVYEPVLEEISENQEIAQPDGSISVQAVTREEIKEQSVRLELFDSADFLHNKAKVWRKVWWVAFRHFMSEDDLKAKFGEEKARSIELKYSEESEDRGEKAEFQFTRS
jgi:hypothetical protein